MTTDSSRSIRWKNSTIYDTIWPEPATRPSLAANGNSNGCPAGGCDGYELTQSLDFADPASYASGLIEMDWRPDDADPDMATNAGWDPIGGCETTDDLDYFQCFDDNDEPFVATFEGNGNTISGLYTRGGRAAGLFGSVGSSAVIRNVGVIGGASYGGADSSDIVGILASRNDGTIIASYATGTADGGGDGSSDRVGALVGWNDDSGNGYRQLRDRIRERRRRRQRHRRRTGRLERRSRHRRLRDWKC